ncbi:MAG: prephenate dehydrogenase/arogenate dehydrogenase family protein, partial [Thermoleophilaceae bacterium]
MRIAVLGVGLIGGSIGLAARKRVEGSEVVGFGRNAERLDRARELGAIDRTAATLAEALDGASACFCCAPVGALGAQISAALAAAGDDCVVTDVGSIKGGILDAADDARFVGGHPIAGAETAGVEHARADLFEGATWYLTPTERSSGILFERLHRLVAALGARPVAIDAESHDRLLATVSHLPHVLANVLVTQAAGAVAEADAGLPRVGPSFRD